MRENQPYAECSNRLWLKKSVLDSESASQSDSRCSHAIILMHILRNNALAPGVNESR